MHQARLTPVERPRSELELALADKTRAYSLLHTDFVVKMAELDDVRWEARGGLSAFVCCCTGQRSSAGACVWLCVCGCGQRLRATADMAPWNAMRICLHCTR